ncbi:aspartate aminotransferase family protein [Kordiimonas sediminis]|uniref:Aspartate aminotransferase family protein n=1 Tax=Kordiimonas sediminis TaxID=1735581 RepID=A0A919E5Y7_9PROT|nr:aminotransferase [Kordiimonas sediminis]GHF22536.1 aspartate aminotransferase family protein [Kordiimonas sediminis]
MAPTDDNNNIHMLQDIDRAHHLHPFTDPQALKTAPPFVVESAEGCMIQGQGMSLLDAMAGLGCVNIGYGRTEMAQTAAKAMEELSFYHSFAAITHPAAAKLADKLAALAPGNLNKVFFANSGSEANETALKLIQYYWLRKGKPNKTIILSRDFSYHGSTLATSALNGLTAMHEPFGIKTKGHVEHVMSPFWYRFGGDMTEEAFAEHAAKAIEDKILEIGPGRIAAFVGEPIQGTLGAIMPPKGYWPKVAEICRKYDVLLLVDEVVTGMGRTGNWFAQETYGFEADLMSLAKGLSSGYQPISALMLSDSFAEVVEAESAVLQHGFTTSGHPVAAAVALKNIEILERENLIGRIKSEIGPYFKQALETLLDHPLVGEVRVEGLIAAVELTKNKVTREQYPYEWGVCQHVANAALMQRLIVRPAGNVLVMCPPFTISSSEIDQLVNGLSSALDQTYAALQNV